MFSFDFASVIAPTNWQSLLRLMVAWMLEIRSFFLSKAHSRLVPECWKSVRPSLANSLKMLFVGNLHALPLLNFFAGNPFTASFPSVLVKSDLPSRKFGSLSPHLKNGVNPLSRALFVHYRAILIQIEPLAAFDSQHTNIGILSTLPFRVSKQLISNIGNSSGHTNRSVRAVRFFLSEIRILFLS